MSETTQQPPPEPRPDSDKPEPKDKPLFAPKPGPSKGPNNRKRPFNRTPAQPAKRGKANFQKLKASPASTTSVLFTAYELETSFHGARALTSELFDILANRDQKITHVMTKYHLCYVTLLAAIYRSLLVSSKSTTTIVRGLSYLKETIQNVLLPDCVCQYIESIGYVRMTAGYTVIPYIRGYHEMQRKPGFLDPAVILHMIQNRTSEEQWAVDDRTILEYKQAISRVLKNAIKLRIVNNEELEGRPAFTAAWTDDGNGRMHPLAFEEMPTDACQLGAAFMFRNASDRELWNGTIFPPIIHETMSVSRNTFLTDWILALLKGDSE